MSSKYSVPDSILIVGSGAFGLSTAYALSQDPNYDSTKILIVDKWPFESSESGKTVPNPTGSSTDTSRIVRADYTKGPYADLAVKAQEQWRGDWGAEGRYSQSGYLLMAKDGDTERLSTGGYNHVTLAYENSIRVTGDKSKIQLLTSEAEIEKVSGYPITAGQATSDSKQGAQWKGYINRTAGWVDAAASMKYLREKVLATKRVTPICGTVQRLLYSTPTDSTNDNDHRRIVTGVILTSGEKILARQTILAAGPYTPSLTDLRAACEARGQIVNYIKLTPEERAQFPEKGSPCMMDASSGLFIVGPDHEGFLKITRDSKGYRNPVNVKVASDGGLGLKQGLENGAAAPLSSAPEALEKEISTSIPWSPPPSGSKLTTEEEISSSLIVTPEGTAACRAYLQRLFPSPCPPALSGIPNRPFARTRNCWYTDTRTAHFIISYHPKYAAGSLFIATGGSGHAFKFLPVIGEKAVGILKAGPDDTTTNNTNGEPSKAVTEEIRILKSLWKFPSTLKGDNDDGIVWCEDGSRHGREDLIWETALKA